MKLILVLLAMTAGATALDAQADPRLTYDAVVKGMSRKQSSIAGLQLDCDYRVGQDLHFVIAGAGQDDAAFTVLRTAGYDGDYYATFGVLHGCVIVKPGSRSRRPALLDMAFVSPTDGKVYRTWQECAQSTRTSPHNYP